MSQIIFHKRHCVEKTKHVFKIIELNTAKIYLAQICDLAGCLASFRFPLLVDVETTSFCSKKHHFPLMAIQKQCSEDFFFFFFFHLNNSSCFNSEIIKTCSECCLSCLISGWSLLLYTDNYWHGCSTIQLFIVYNTL